MIRNILSIYKILVFASDDNNIIPLKTRKLVNDQRLRVRKNFFFRPGKCTSTSRSIDRCKRLQGEQKKSFLFLFCSSLQTYYHGEPVAIHLKITNRSHKQVKRLKVSIQQLCDVSLGVSGQLRHTLSSIDTQ